MLSERSGVAVEALLPHLYVHYDDGAVSHLFQVSAGLDSMAVGEAQILGQARTALQMGQEIGTVGPALNSLFQQALRVGKRAHAETDIDKAAPSLVNAALQRATRVLGSLEGKRAVVLGAGAMAGLSAATLARAKVGELVIVNRTEEKARRLASDYHGRAVGLDQLSVEVAAADLVIAAAGARRVLITEQMATASRAVLIDLALPHDIDPILATREGVTLIDLASLAAELHASEAGQEVAAVRAIVTQEVGAFLNARRQASVTPTVVALRSMATSVVDAEIARLQARLPELDEPVRDEVVQAIRRVADKLLHEPTVRVKELANETGAVSYAAALAELFALDPDAVQAVTRPVVEK